MIVFWRRHYRCPRTCLIKLPIWSYFKACWTKRWHPVHVLPHKKKMLFRIIPFDGTASLPAIWVVHRGSPWIVLFTTFSLHLLLSSMEFKFGWTEPWEGLLVLTDVSTSWAKVIFRVKWLPLRMLKLTSVTTNSISQDSFHPNDQIPSRHGNYNSWIQTIFYSFVFLGRKTVKIKPWKPESIVSW